MRALCCLPLLVILSLPGTLAARCKTSPVDSPIPQIHLSPFITGLEHPVHLTHAGDGSGRLFVVEQAGVIRIIENGKLQPTPFLDIRNRVESGGEKGLLSVAFHPEYTTNGRLFVNYTSDRGGLHTRIAEFRRRDRNRANPASEKILLTVDQPYSNHNGGQIAFGPDGMLYIGMGDGGWANDPKNSGQDRTTLLGALLRIDINNTSRGKAYGIPTDNPYATHKRFRPEIWAYGLRNPWRFSFDRQSGQLWAADVGQDAIEEIDRIERGQNYGWKIMEGRRCANGVAADCARQDLTPPVTQYPHGEGYSVTGGFVYRGDRYPELCGVYLYADYVTGQFWGLRHVPGQPAQVRKNGKFSFNISSFGEDQTGELYVTGYRQGSVFRLSPAKP